MSVAVAPTARRGILIGFAVDEEDVEEDDDEDDDEDEDEDEDEEADCAVAAGGAIEVSPSPKEAITAVVMEARFLLADAKTADTGELFSLIVRTLRCEKLRNGKAG